METQKPSISPLRQRMIDDMRMRKFGEKTQLDYIRAVRNFTKYLGRSPDTATVEDLRNYQLHLVDHGVSPASLNSAISGLKFFFNVTLDRPELVAKMQPVHLPRKLPVILSPEEVKRLIAAAGNLKHQTALALAYAIGLRVNEVAVLKVGDIDSQRMTLRVEQDKKAIYRLLFDVAAETLLTIAADSKHLGARIGATLVLHTWGSAMTHHPHVHGIVPGGGLSPNGERWVACRRGFFLAVRVLSQLFRRRFIEELEKLHRAGQLCFFGHDAGLAEATAFARWLAPLRASKWVAYAKRPFAGPQAVLAYLARYTHRVAISNRRLVRMDENGVTFRWKDYRAKGRTRQKTMTLVPDEFMRRFLLHVLPGGFHRIRHYGLLANAERRRQLTQVRKLLNAPPPESVIDDTPAVVSPTFICRCGGGTMSVAEVILRRQPIRAPP